MRSVLAKLLPIIKVSGLLILLAVSACHRSGNFIDDQEPKLPCKVKGACDATIKKYLVKFSKQKNIKVISVGQDFLISIPASALFANQSPRLLWPGYSLLNEVVGFMKQFRLISVHINSYSSKYVSAQREHSLTLARSRMVAEYLWTQGIDSRFIFTQGLGSDKPIAKITQGGDQSPNARIEITFRRAVA